MKGQKYGRILFFTAVKGALFLLLYGVFWNSNAKDEICQQQNGFLALTAAYGALALVIIFWDFWMPPLKKKIGIRIRKGVWVLLWAAAPVFSYLTTELACNEIWNKIAWKYAVCNCLLYLICGVMLALILGSARIALTLVEIISLIYGIASHYVLEFKDTTLRPSELMGARTGIAVAGGYSYALTDNLVKAILLCMFACILIRFATGKELFAQIEKGKRGKRLAIRLSIAACGAALLCVAFLTVDVSELTGVTVRGWRPGKTYRETGSALCFLIDCQNLRIEEPEGYTAEKAEEILASYNAEDASTTDGQEIQPNVIVIMNESFSDLSVIGSFESDDYLANLNSVTDYMMKGYAYVSAFGGGTCNSEFEFLTGSTLGFLGSGSFPYQTMQFDSVTSMAEVFNDLGYQTLAMHPSLATNWNRTHVYGQMGFDDFISLSNGFADATTWKDDWVDDASDYRELIRQLEAAEEPLFLFNVTTQNHGGYDVSKLEGKDLVEIEEAYQQYERVVPYLTGIKYSDEALGELIEYLRDFDEPVLLCFFGDHQAKLGDPFLNALESSNAENEGKTELEILQNRYKVPYLIWSNYLDPEGTDMDLSLNYLGAWLLNYAGAQTSYSEYLLDLQETVQAVNVNGYMEDGTWISLEDPDEELKNYELVQYYRLFDS